MSDSYSLRVYVAPSGQYSGQLWDDEQLVLGVAGCASLQEVEQAVLDAGYDAYALLLSPNLSSLPEFIS